MLALLRAWIDVRFRMSGRPDDRGGGDAIRNLLPIQNMARTVTRDLEFRTKMGRETRSCCSTCPPARTRTSSPTLRSSISAANPTLAIALVLGGTYCLGASLARLRSKTPASCSAVMLDIHLGYRRRAAPPGIELLQWPRGHAGAVRPRAGRDHRAGEVSGDHSLLEPTTTSLQRPIWGEMSRQPGLMIRQKEDYSKSNFNAQP